MGQAGKTEDQHGRKFRAGRSRSLGKTISPLAFEAIRHFTNNFYDANEGYSKNAFSSVGFAIAMAICTSITSISRRKR